MDPSSVPSQWVFWKDAVGNNRSGWKKIPPDVVKIMHKYVAVPRTVMGLIGDPDWVHCYFDAFDMILGPAGDDGRRIIKDGEHYGKMITITSKKNNLADLLKRGHYPYKIEDLRGVPVLRVPGCASLQVTHGYVEHWQMSIQRLHNPNI